MYETDDFAQAADARGRILAKRQGDLSEFEETKSYREQGREVQDRISLPKQSVEAPEWRSKYEEWAEHVLPAFDNKFSLHVDASFEDWKARREGPAANRPVKGKDKFENLVSASTFNEAEAVPETPPADRLPDDGNLTLTVQKPIDPTVAVSLEQQSPAAFLETLLTRPGAFTLIVKAIRDLADSRQTHELDYQIASSRLPDRLMATTKELAEKIDRSEDGETIDLAERESIRECLREFTKAGHNDAEALFGIADLLAFLDETPRIHFQLKSAFFENRADYRRRICTFISLLSRSADVRITASGIDQHKLAKKHRSELRSVSGARNSTPKIGRVVQNALTTVGVESREVDLLRELVDDPGESLTYSALTSRLSVSRSRIRQLVNGQSSDDTGLKALKLVTTYESTEGYVVELTPGGREFVASLNRKVGQQQPLSDAVSEARNSSKHGREGPREDGEGDRTEAQSDSSLVSVKRMEPTAAIGSVAAAPQGGIGISEARIPAEDYDRWPSPLWYHDDEHQRLVVGTEFQNPMQYWVSIARALTNRRIWKAVIPPEQIEERDEFPTLHEENTRDLRGGRCLGHLPDTVANAEDYVDTLNDARDELMAMTTDLHNGDYECPTADKRSRITSDALGLAGTMVHLLDLLDIDVIQQVRLPKWTSWQTEYREAQADDLGKAIAKAIAIQGLYRGTTFHRTIYEHREEKVKRAIIPDADHEDPVGEFCASISIVGPGVSAVSPLIEDHIEHPTHLTVRDDAPEVRMDVPLETEPGRAAFAQAVVLACQARSLIPTREAVSLFQALAGSPFDVAEGILHGLASEATLRELTIDEARRALSILGKGQLLPTEKASTQELFGVLLGAEAPLSKSTLADLADCSKRTVSKNIDALTGLELVEKTETGYRVVLNRRDERHDRSPEAALPSYINDSHLGTLVEQVHALLREIVGVEPYAREEGALQYPELHQNPADLDAVLDRWPSLNAHLPVLRWLLSTPGISNAPSWLADRRSGNCHHGRAPDIQIDADRNVTPLRMGPSLQQAPISAFATASTPHG